MHKQKGFTLAELLLVIAILSILLTIAIPRMDIIQTSRLDGAARMVWSDMHLAKMTAIKNNDSLKVFFNSSGYHFELNSNDEVIFTREMSDDYANILISSNQNPITFNSRGRGDSGTISLTLSSTSSGQKIITIFNGRVGQVKDSVS